jgi:hypothetical protein
LMATSRTPNARPKLAANWLRGRVRAHLVPNSRAVAFGRRPRGAWVGAGMVVLVGLTTWAVASVSVWMAPAYLALMVLIFVAPMRGRPSKPASESGWGSLYVGDADIGQSLRVDRAAGADDNRPAAEFDSAVAADEAATEPLSSIADSAGSAGAKPKRGRARGRKAAKTAAEPALDSAPVTWIRVGPGKFVRADATIQAIDPTQVEEVEEAEAVPATDAADASTTPTPTDVAPAAPLDGQDPGDLPATTPGDVGIIVRSDDSVVGPVTEEYGITPSAFGQSSQVTAAAEGLDQNVSEADPGRLGSQRRTPTARTGRISRGVASAISGADQASSRCLGRTPPRPRTSVWSPYAPNARLQQATRRAFGRITHVHRALRPRSPPRR